MPTMQYICIYVYASVYVNTTVYIATHNVYIYTQNAVTYVHIYGIHR